MKIELKNVEYSARMSEETSCFIAMVYIDGKAMGQVQNDGHGGCHRYRSVDLERLLDAEAKKLPPIKTEMPDPHDPTKKFEYQPDADAIVDKALEDFLMRKDLKQDLKKKLLYTVKGKPGLYSTKNISMDLIKKAISDRNWLNTQIKDIESLLNGLPFEEAFAIYVQKAK